MTSFDVFESYAINNPMPSFLGGDLCVFVKLSHILWLFPISRELLWMLVYVTLCIIVFKRGVKLSQWTLELEIFTM